MGIKKLLLLATIAAGGCAPWTMNSSHHYDVYVDPSFSSRQSNEIVAAERAWTEALGGYITFSRAASADASSIRVWASTITQLHQKRDPTCVGFTKWHGVQSDVELPIDVSIDDDTFNRIVRHELGHAIGAHHISAFHTMAENVTVNSEAITCEDLHEVCRHWGPTCVWLTMRPCVVQASNIKL